MILLDTCALLWLAEGGERLSKRARARIEAAPVLYVSAISAFEIGVKYRSGKLKLPAPPMEWFGGILAHHGIAVQPLSWEVCIAATELPNVHRDPCDRFKIATAKLCGFPVITGDPHFSAYGIEVLS